MLAISIHEFKRQSTALAKEGMTMQGGTKQNPKVRLVEKARKDILECWFSILVFSVSAF
jgi:hypothetical protein